jgi:hypothetical protein
MLAKARLALITLLLVVGHAAAPAAVRASTTQEITFEAIPDLPLVVFSIELEAVSSAGLPVSFGSETPFVCDVVDGNTVVFRDLGTCTIRAAQEGDGTYSPAEPVLQSFVIFPYEDQEAASGDQEITFDTIPDHSILVSQLELAAVSSAGLPVSFGSETPLVCDVDNIDGNTVVFLDVGTCTIRASQEGDETFSPAEPVLQSFLILADERLSHEIVFETIANKSILLGSFTLQGVSSAGATIVYKSTTPATCGVEGNVALLLHAGSCTIQASHDGDETYFPANSVSRSFSILPGMLANKTITFVDADGRPIAGRTVYWQTKDGRYRSATSATTNAAGQITYKQMPAGYVYFSVSGDAVSIDGQLMLSAAQHVVSVGVSATRVVGLLSTSTIGASNMVVHVQMTDGTGVPGASVSITGGSDVERCIVSREEGSPPWDQWDQIGAQPSGSWSQESFSLPDCNRESTTDVNGDATFPVLTDASEDGENSESGASEDEEYPECFDGICPNSYYATARYTEGDMFVISEAIEIVDGEAWILVDQLPVVDLLAQSAIVNLGAPQLLTAFARNIDGSPIAGSTLTLSPSVSGASAACSGQKSTARTDSSGRATFKVCPVKSATWSVDGPSIVGSAGVKLTVQRTPTAPRTLVVTPKTRSVSLAWITPVKANASAVIDYIVQYRRRGATTWLTFRDGTSTARKATVTGLTSGVVYEFRIAARSKAGTGTWSSVVLGTPRK